MTSSTSALWTRARLDHGFTFTNTDSPKQDRSSFRSMSKLRNTRKFGSRLLVVNVPPLFVFSSLILQFYPGLSSFEDKAGDIGAMSTYFEPILNFGREHVPAAKRQSTAFFVLASAGMRKVRERSESVAQRIMDTAYNHLASSSGFVVHRDGIKIIEGRNEGLWGWVAANYLNGELGKLLQIEPRALYSKQTTKGIVEMGGESLQITFIPRESALRTQQQQHIESLSIGNAHFDLFTNSWMGIGMEAAQNAYDSHLVHKGLRQESPCYIRGLFARNDSRSLHAIQ